MKCVRCNSEYEIPNSPYAHFSTICFECRDKEPETIFDQQKYISNLLSNWKNVYKLLNEIKETT